MGSEDPELFPSDSDTSTPHKDKLQKLISNPKLPEADRNSVRQSIEKYESWIEQMDSLNLKGDEKVKALVDTLNEYLSFVELELIWDSEADFLFRQRGQLKLGNTILEEFLPRLADPDIIPALEGKAYSTGPRKSFSGAHFAATLASSPEAASLQIRTKDQDFAVGRMVYIRSSFDRNFTSDDLTTQEAYLAFIAAECKTNLDKTMFQEAVATARDLKNAVPGSRYYLLCEWLDMTPISTLPTDINEVIILRGKRLSSQVRGEFSAASARKSRRGWYANFLEQHPIRYDRVVRFVEHIRSLFDALKAEEEQDVVERGYF